MENPLYYSPILEDMYWYYEIEGFFYLNLWRLNTNEFTKFTDRPSLN